MQKPVKRGTERQQLISKLLIAAAGCIGCNGGMCGYAAAGGPTKVSWKIGMPLLMIMFQVIVILTGLILPLSDKKQRKIYWIVSELLFAVTFVFWGSILLITHWDDLFI